MIFIYQNNTNRNLEMSQWKLFEIEDENSYLPPFSYFFFVLGKSFLTFNS